MYGGKAFAHRQRCVIQRQGVGIRVIGHRSAQTVGIAQNIVLVCRSHFYAIDLKLVKDTLHHKKAIEGAA